MLINSFFPLSFTSIQLHTSPEVFYGPGLPLLYSLFYYILHCPLTSPSPFHCSLSCLMLPPLISFFSTGLDLGDHHVPCCTPSLCVPTVPRHRCQPPLLSPLTFPFFPLLCVLTPPAQYCYISVVYITVCLYYMFVILPLTKILLGSKAQAPFDSILFHWLSILDKQFSAVFLHIQLMLHVC